MPGIPDGAGGRPVAANGTRRPGGGGGRSPWQPIVDAAATIAARYSDPAALDAIGALEGGEDACRALGEAFRKVGATSVDAVYFDPRVAPFFAEAGDMILRMAPHFGQAAGAVKRAHADDMERLEDGSQRRRRWDISANDPR